LTTHEVKSILGAVVCVYSPVNPTTEPLNLLRGKYEKEFPEDAHEVREKYLEA